MRLALILYGSLDTISGGYLYDRMLVQHLRANGDTVDLISLPWRNYAVHLTQNFWLRLPRYDAVLQDELNHPSLFFANRFIAPPRIAIVHHLRCNEQRPAWQKLFYRLIEQTYLRTVDGFIYNSQTTRGAVERLLPTPRPAQIAHPAGNHLGVLLDPDQIRERAGRPGPLKLLFVGNVIPRKGLGTLLDALAQIPDGWELNAVGSLTTDPNYVAKLGRRLTPRIKLLGSITDSLITNYYLQSDLLVVPSTYEGFGIVYLEGMAFGLPAIATTAGAAGEIITHGENGFLVAPNDSAALAEHIRLLINDREKLLRMSLAARERFLRHPTWEQSMETVRAFIHRLVVTT
jgi:glycosyltransferase involved in cell wall biosynthesis